MRRTVHVCFLALGLGATVLAAGAEAAEPYVVRGQAVSAEGAVAGAEVRLLHRPPRPGAWSDDAAEPRVADEIRVTADATGRFEIAVELDEVVDDLSDPWLASARWILEVSAPGLAPTRIEIPPGRYVGATEARARPGAVEELGGILLHPGLRVVGRVVAGGGAGRAVAGARVALWPEIGPVLEPWTATSGEDGSFLLDGVPPGTYVAAFDRPGWVPLRQGPLPVQPASRRSPRADEPGASDPKPPPAVDLGTVALDRPVTVSGRVIDGAGKPLAGVAVRYRHEVVDLGIVADDWLPEVGTETGADGEFLLAGLPPEPERRFLFRKEGYQGWIRRFELEPAADGWRLVEPVVLTENLVVRGRVVEPSGEPIAGAQAHWQNPNVIELVAADSEGRFEVVIREEKNPSIFVAAPGYASKTLVVEAFPVFSEEIPVATLVLEPIATTDLRLVVRDADGAPVADAQVTFGLSDPGPAHYRGNRLTDRSGQVSLDKVPLADRYSLEIEHPEHPQYYRDDVTIAVGQELLEVALDPAPWRLASVSGRVIDGDGEPVPGASVALSRPDSGLAEYRTGTDVAGHFELERIREGAYSLRAEASGHAPAVVPLRVIPGVEPTTVTLGPGATLYGTVRGGTAGGRSAWKVRVQSGLRLLQAVVDGDRYRVEYLEAGTWTVVAEADGVETTTEVEIPSGRAEVRLDLELPAVFEVRGLILLDGAPWAHAGLSLQSTPGAPHAYHSGSTDGRGRFLFDKVAAGSYGLYYVGELGSFRRPVVVEGDAEMALDFETTHLRGRVVDASSGVGLAEAAVEGRAEIMMSHGPTFETVTDTAGHFEIGPVLAESWGIHAKAPGYVDGRRQVELPTVTPVVVELTPTAGLRVHVESVGSRLPSYLRLELRDAGGERVASESLNLGGGPDGHWVDAPPGSYRLIAGNRFVRIEAEVEIPGPVVTLRFPPAGALAIRVPELELESDVPGRPPQVPVRVEAVLEAPDDPGFDGARVRRSGRLYLETLTPGLWRVEVRTEDGRVWTGSVRIADGQRHELYLSSD